MVSRVEIEARKNLLGAVDGGSTIVILGGVANVAYTVFIVIGVGAFYEISFTLAAIAYTVAALVNIYANVHIII